MVMRKCVLFLMLFVSVFTDSLSAQQNQIALLKYRGGGDWYANPTSLKNLISFCNRNTHTDISENYATVDVGSQDLFNYPFLHLTGHGNVVFSKEEADNLRSYLISGGFLHIDDNYGLDKYIRPQMKKVFPELDFVELPLNHPIYKQKYDFSSIGLPKIHEHDNKRPRGLGLIYKNRLVCFYTYETDLGDGWEDIEVHNSSKNKHIKALQMGTNILMFTFIQ